MKEITGAELLKLLEESAYDDGQWLETAVGNMNRILGRGDKIAVYQNQDLGHPELGHRQYVSYGSTEALLETDEPPERLPDFPQQINWRYGLECVCTAGPVPLPGAGE